MSSGASRGNYKGNHFDPNYSTHRGRGRGGYDESYRGRGRGGSYAFDSSSRGGRGGSVSSKRTDYRIIIRGLGVENFGFGAKFDFRNQK